MRAPVLALLLALPLLAAGCIGEALATAMEARDPADEAARLWNPEAELAGALGIEGTGPLALWAVGFLTSTDVSHAKGDQDAKVGDGRAEAWVYKYVARGVDEAYAVVIDREGTVRHTRVEDRKAGDVALEGWTVDSDAALGLAADANQGIREGLGHEDYGVLSALTAESDLAVWHVIGGGRGADGGAGGYVKIDATSGEVLSSVGGFGR